MRWSKPASWVAGFLILLTAIGAVATLGIEPLGLGGGSFEYQSRATATVLLVIVVLIVAVAVGSRAGGWLSTPYW